MTRVDAHVHVWDLARGGYDWPDASVPDIHRSMTFAEVAPQLTEAGFGSAVLVQAADTAVDTAHMLETADADPRVAGVVAWTDLGAEADVVAADLARLRRHPTVVGIRALVHVRPDPGWVTTSRPLAALGEVARAGLVHDYVTADPAGLAHLPTVLDRHPDLPVVLDHLGKPPVGGSQQERREWLALLRDVAAPQVSAKVSGLYASRGPLDSWTPAQVRPFVEDALDVFGPERLMYGGDWPVAVLAGGYRRTAEAVTGILADLLGPADLEQVLGGTARRVYGLG